MRILPITSIALGICISFVSAFGQVIEPANQPKGCEINQARLDNLGLSFSKLNDDTLLIIIGHLGSGETSAEINRHRLYNAREYILARTPSLRRDRTLTAEGEKLTGLGKVEFYVGGKVVDSLLVGKNRILCVDCCQNPLFKPYKGNQRKSRKK